MGYYVPCDFASAEPSVMCPSFRDASSCLVARSQIVCTMPETADVAHHPFQAEIDDLVACVLDGRETSITVFDAQRTMEVCLAADRSAELGGTPVSLPLIAD